MKRTFKKSMSILLAFTLLFGSFAFGLSDVNFADFAVKAEAEDATETFTEGYYTYTVDENGNATITGVDNSIGGDVIIPETLGGYTVRNIGRFALMGLGIESVTISDTIEVISNYAFSDCYNLRDIFWGENSKLKYIYPYAFKGCSSIEKITFPSEITNIYEGAFVSCDKLSNISFAGDSIIAIDIKAFEDTAFYSNEKNWDNGILYVDEYLVSAENYSGDGKVVVREGTKAILESAFCYKEITSAVLPSSLKRIESDAFRTCISLSEIIIPDSVETIGGYAFYGCLNLSSIKIGSGVKNIYNQAFDETNYYINIDNWENGVLYIDNCLIKADENLVSAEYIIKEKTQVITYGAFMRIGTLKNVIFPKSLTSIGDFAFAWCSNLENVQLPSSLTSIGEAAFHNCNSFTSIEVPSNVTIIGDGALGGCYNNTSIKVDSDNQFFSNDERGVLFNKDKTELILYPMGNKSTSYEMPDETIKIKDRAFSFCGSLTNISFSKCLEIIGEYAFEYTSIEIFEIPNGVTKIGTGAFSHCNVKKISIPASVKVIGENPFVYCWQLEEITVSNGNENYSSDEYGVLFNKKKTLLIQYPIGNQRTSYLISATVKVIGSSSFEGCNYLTDIVIEDNSQLTEIGTWAFMYCNNLSNVSKIPATVNRINSSFERCAKLQKIEVDGNNSYFSSDKFGVLFNKNKTTLIQYPAGSSLKNYTVPDTVTLLDNHCFEMAQNLSSVTIPLSVKNIFGAFMSCAALSTIYYEGSPSQWNMIYISSGGTGDCMGNLNIIYANEDDAGEIFLESIVSTPTDVRIDYVSNFHKGEVTVEVERTLDEAAFDIITTELDITDNIIYDIKMIVDGVETQPNGTVTVRIPLPQGYNPTKTFVYHISAGNVENMNAVIETINEKQYLVFETDHFSYYAVVELADTEISTTQPSTTELRTTKPAEIPATKPTTTQPATKPEETTKPTTEPASKPAVEPAKPVATVPSTKPATEPTTAPTTKPVVEEEIIKKPSTSTVKYGETLILHADFENIPADAKIEWSVEGNGVTIKPSTDGKTCAVTSTSTGDVTITAKYVDADGVEHVSEQEIKSNASFWQKIVSFFKNLFGINRIIEQTFKF